MIDYEAQLLEQLGQLFPLTSIEERKTLKRGVFPWDSFRHIELVLQIEKFFEIEFSVEDALRAQDFQSLLRVICDRATVSSRKT